MVVLELLGLWVLVGVAVVILLNAVKGIVRCQP